MIRHLYTDGRDRARALGIWTAVSGLALALGPVIGGILVGIWSWRAVFWFNLVFGLVALVGAAIVLPENVDPVKPPARLPRLRPRRPRRSAARRLRHRARRDARLR